MSTAAAPDEGAAEPASRTATTGVLTIAAVASAVGVLVATARYGMGLTPDSVVYRVGAQSIADGRGFTDRSSEAGPPPLDARRTTSGWPRGALQDVKARS